MAKIQIVHKSKRVKISFLKTPDSGSLTLPPEGAMIPTSFSKYLLSTFHQVLCQPSAQRVNAPGPCQLRTPGSRTRPWYL